MKFIGGLFLGISLILFLLFLSADKIRKSLMNVANTDIGKLHGGEEFLNKFIKGILLVAFIFLILGSILILA